MEGLTRKRKAAMDAVMKNAIFEATVRVLTEHGMEGMTMERVAETAGVAKGTLYNYFADKTDLLFYACDRVVDPIFEKAEATIKTDATPEEKLEKMVWELFAHLNSNLNLMRVFSEVHTHYLRDAEQHWGKMMERRRNHLTYGIRLIAEVIEEGVRKKRFRELDPMKTAAMLVGAVHLLILTKIEIDKSALEREDVNEFMDTFLPGLKWTSGVPAK
jgi:AcrR family transcriptional regulator